MQQTAQKFAFVYWMTRLNRNLRLLTTNDELSVCQTEIIKLISGFNQHIFHNLIKLNVNDEV